MNNINALDFVPARTYSHAPAQAAIDVSNIGADYPLSPNGEVIPFDCTPDNSDPLSGFLAQSDTRPTQTEAERIGADRYGFSWPMLRAQRLHSGDTHVTDSLMRRALSHTRIGEIFTPLEMPQNPELSYRGKRRK
jgi:hypothetical protein